jgi:signal transduction histidine kinase
MSYQDDGKGLSSAAGKKPGMGMQNVEARLRMIGANSEMPTTDKGFLMKISIPA